MKCLLAVVALVGGVSSAAHAATILPLDPGFDDTAFRAACSAAGGGTGDQGCESAVAQIRAGDGDGGGRAENELIVQDIAVNPGGVAKPTISQQSHFALVDGTTYLFSLAYDAAQEQLALTFGATRDANSGLLVGGTTVSGAEDLAGLETLFVRTNAGSRGSVALTNLSFDGMSLPDLSGPQQYLAVGGIDTTNSFVIEGEATFDFIGTKKPRSNPIAEFKFTNVPLEVAPVPLPAAGVLLLAGVAGLGALGARRRVRA
jgi:hypothetical protein